MLKVSLKIRKGYRERIKKHSGIAKESATENAPTLIFVLEIGSP